WPNRVSRCHGVLLQSTPTEYHAVASFPRPTSFIRENADENADEITGDRGTFVSLDDRPGPCSGLLHVSGVGPAERPGPDHVHRGGLRFPREYRVSGNRVDLSPLFEVCQRPGPDRTTCEKCPHVRGRASGFAKKTGAGGADQLSDRALRRAPELRSAFVGRSWSGPNRGSALATTPRMHRHAAACTGCTDLFDHLVGDGEPPIGHFEAERHCGPEIDRQLVLDHDLHREVG